MRRLALIGLVVIAGCGGGGGRDSTGRPAMTPTPPDSETLKHDLLTAAIQLEAYKLAEHRYTDDETQMGEAFPPTVTIKASGATSFSMAARDDEGVRYTLIKEGGVTARECKPARRDVCPHGRW